MPTTVKEIYHCIDTIAPFERAMDFDNCGILAGDANAQVQTALVALDITKDVVEEAVQKKAQLIISHHPVIFQPLRSLPFDSPVGLLAQNHIAAICAHTNLDLSPCGVNVCLAQALGLTNQKLIDGECMVTGALVQPLAAYAFAMHVKTALSCAGVRFTAIQKQVKTVAVSGGAGGDGLYKALQLCADAFVTGEIKHHQLLDAASCGLCIVDAGHFKTENVVIHPLTDFLSKQFPDTAFFVSERCTDHIAYL